MATHEAFYDWILNRIINCMGNTMNESELAMVVANLQESAAAIAELNAAVHDAMPLMDGLAQRRMRELTTRTALVAGCASRCAINIERKIEEPQVYE